MARTLRRQRKRSVRATTSKRHVTTDDDELWSQLEESLFGLLAIDFNDDVTDVDHLCPGCVRLRVRLDLVRVGAHDKVERLMQRVMDALGLLCVLEEESRQDAETFWTRIVVSQMMMSPWDATEDACSISEVATFTQAHGLRLVFSWENRPFQPHAAHAIGSFLQSPRRKYYERLLLRCEEHPRLVRVGLRFVDCRVTSGDLTMLIHALAVTKLTSECDLLDVPLCGVYTLQSVEFRAVVLGADELNALAAVVTSPHTRRVDGLSLEETIQLTSASEYVSAFKRALKAALQAKHTDAVGPCEGFNLSLAHNEKIQPVHIEAVHEALAEATRPLRGLDLNGILGEDHGTWLRVGQLIFTPPRVPCAAACELNINALSNVQAAMDTLSFSLANMVAEWIPRVVVALVASQPVFCRVSDSNGELSPHEMHQIVSVRASGESFSGWVLISNPSSPETPTWVSSSSISCLRIGDRDVVGCPFTRLVGHGDGYILSNRSAAQHFGHLFGNRLEHLVFGNHYANADLVTGLLAACPHTRALDMNDTRFHQYCKTTTWDAVSALRLQVINLRNCDINAQSVAALLTRLQEARPKTLRSLNLWGCNYFDAEVLELLHRVLHDTPSLQLVVMPTIPAMRLASDDPLRRQLEAIDAYLHAQYLSTQIQQALMSIVRRDRRDDLYWDQHILQRIFEFTGSRQRRVLRWDKEEPEA